MSIRRSLASLAAFARKSRMDRELEEEIRTHLELAAHEAIARGLPPEQARAEALRQFGGIEQMKEEHRDRRSVPWLETLIRDFQYGLGNLRRAPGFTIVVTAVLALGIGGTVAMFSVVDAVLVKPLPFPQPDRLVRVWEEPHPGAINATTASQFLSWKRAGAFSALSAESPVSAALNNSEGPTRVAGKAVTSAYFNVFGAGAQLGRTFMSEDDKPGAAPVLVISNSAWQTYFGSDPDILNRRIVLDGQPYQVAGVLRPGAFDREQTQFWKPLIFTPAQIESRIHWLTVYGRLRAGASVTEARDQLQAIYASEMETASEDRGGSIAVETLSRLFVGRNLQRSILIAFGAVLIVLAIACANVANLLFSQGVTRQAELAVRSALGAARARLLAQLLTESLALCLLGGLAGVCTAYIFVRLAKPLLIDSLPFTADVNLNVQVLLFAASLTILVTLVAGATPAFKATSGDLTYALKRAGRSTSYIHLRLRRMIVTGEIALSLVLISGAFLLLRSLQRLQQLDTGLRIENVVVVSADLPFSGYPTPQKAALFYQSVADRLRSVPGVTKAGMATYMPLQWISNGEAIFLNNVEKPLRVRFKRVDPGYFETLDIPLLGGRGITARDRDGSPRVIVINQALQRQLAEVADIKSPLGKTVRLTSTDYEGRNPQVHEVQIVGIIRNERTAGAGDPEPAVVYVPLAQSPNPNVKLVVRTGEQVTGIVTAIRRAIRDVDSTLPLWNFVTLQEVRNETLSGATRPAWVIGVFSFIATLLAAIGLYGVLAHAVAQQRRDVGIRMALGAPPSNVLRRVLANAMAAVGIGILVGLALVFAVTRVLKSLLFEVSPLDPVSLGLACAGMILIGLLAAYLPAYRAAHVDPITALREQ